MRGQGIEAITVTFPKLTQRMLSLSSAGHPVSYKFKDACELAESRPNPSKQIKRILYFLDWAQNKVNHQVENCHDDNESHE